MIDLSPGELDQLDRPHCAMPAHVTGRQEAELERRAQADAMAAIARDIPDPATFARYLPLVVADALCGADTSMMVCEDHARFLRPLGLAEAGTSKGKRFLTAFGIKVRMALMRVDG